MLTAKKATKLAAVPVVAAVLGGVIVATAPNASAAVQIGARQCAENFSGKRDYLIFEHDFGLYCFANKGKIPTYLPGVTHMHTGNNKVTIKYNVRSKPGKPVLDANSSMGKWQTRVFEHPSEVTSVKIS